jgi:pimeloyl-ACP methyl ester carboxylesterase
LLGVVKLHVHEGYLPIAAYLLDSSSHQEGNMDLGADLEQICVKPPTYSGYPRRSFFDMHHPIAPRLPRVESHEHFLSATGSIGLVNTTGERTEVEGLRIHCLMAGQTGPPVLLLHGGGYDSASRSYKQSIGPISQYHKVFAPDWPGYGESDKPKLRYTTDYYVDFLDHLMDALGLEKASLVGTSMGGAISLGFSLRSPQRVEKLVLVDSHGLGKEVPGGMMTYAMVRLPLLSKLVWAAMGRSRRMIRWSLRSVFHDPQAVSGSMVEEDFQAAKKPGEGRAWRYWLVSEIGLGGFRTNFVEQLPTLAVPTLILHGEEDRYVPVSWARRAHALIEDSKLSVLPQCGHWLTREKPSEFNRAVLGFLAGD